MLVVAALVVNHMPWCRAHMPVHRYSSRGSAIGTRELEGRGRASTCEFVTVALDEITALAVGGKHRGCGGLLGRGSLRVP